MSLKLSDTMTKVAMFLGDNGEARLSRELFAEIERLLADEREKGHIEGHTCGDSIIEIDEDGKVKGCAYKIRQLDLTAPSSTEEG